MNFILVSILLTELNNRTGLIGIRVPDDEVTWKHGPEYTFNLSYTRSVETYSDSEKNTTQNMGTNLMGQLKCRPNSPDRLNCRFSCVKFAKFSSETPVATVEDLPGNENYTSLDFGDASFEVSPDGIKEYKFNEKQKLDENLQKLYTFLTSNLYMWSKINLVGMRQNFEDTSAGVCSVTYDMKSRKPNNTTEQKEVATTKPVSSDIEETIEILRQVNIDKCTVWKKYVIINQINDFLPADADINLASSMARFYVTNQNLTTNNMNTYKLEDSNKALIGFLHDHFLLTLAQVEPVKKELMALPNLSTLLTEKPAKPEVDYRIVFLF